MGRLLQTTFGHAWAVRMAAMLAMAAAVALRARWSLLSVWTGLALAGTALSGHAAMHEGPAGAAQHVVQALHVLCAGAWLGSLTPLFGLLAALADPARREAAGVALQRFSGAGHVAVAGVLLTGVGNTLFIVGGLPVPWAGPYQGLLAIKMGLTAVMVLLALANRYGWAPRLGRRPERAVRAIRRGTVAEIVVGAAVLAVVAVLGLLEPG